MFEAIKTGFYGVECQKQNNEYYIFSGCGAWEKVLKHRPTKEDFENFCEEVNIERGF